MMMMNRINLTVSLEIFIVVSYQIRNFPDFILTPFRFEGSKKSSTCESYNLHDFQCFVVLKFRSRSLNASRMAHPYNFGQITVAGIPCIYRPIPLLIRLNELKCS